MRTRSSSNLPGESSPNPTSLNPKRRNRRHSKKPFILEESPVDTMADQRTMAELRRAPTEGYAEAIVVPPILAEQFELKHSLINMMTSDQLFGLEKDNPHDHIHLLRACPHHGFTKLHQFDTFYNALNPADQDSLNSAAGGNLLERRTQDVLTIIENKSKCLTADGNTFPDFQDNIQGYVSEAAINYNQGNSGYRPPGVANQIRPLGFAQSNVQNNQNRFSQPQGYNRGNNFNQDSPYQAPMQQNQVVPLTSFFQMNIASTSGSGPFPSNTIANPKCKLKAITTRSGLVLDGPSIPMPPPFINSKEDARVEETLTDPELGEFTIKVPPHLVQKAKPSSQRNYLVHQRDPLYLNVPYPSRMYKQKQQDKDEIQIHNTTSSSPDHFLEEFADELALITFPLRNDDLPFYIESDLREIEYLLYRDPTKSSDFLPSPEYDSFLFEDFSEVDALPSTNNKDKVFNPDILIQEDLSEVTVRVTPDKNVNMLL
nr:reverse transcriptase domain-containing protein [Tanacetum cinerariifolium]